MIYEIGIYYDGLEHDAQVKLSLPNLHFPQRSYRFWQGGNPISHWIEDPTNNIAWTKTITLGRTTKIYVDDSANKDLSNIDTTMVFGDDFKTLDKWTILNGGGTGTAIATTLNGQSALLLEPQGTSDRVQVNAPFNSPGYYIEVKVISTVTVSGGMIFGFSDGTIVSASEDHPSNGYIYDLTRDGNADDCITKESGGTLTELVKLADSSTANVEYKLKFLWESSNLKAWKDDNLILSTTDTSFTSFDHVFIGADNSYWYVYYIFIHKYLPTEPKILYIRPVTHLLWNLGGSS